LQHSFFTAVLSFLQHLPALAFAHSFFAHFFVVSALALRPSLQHLPVVAFVQFLHLAVDSVVLALQHSFFSVV
jgi:hypothetical protein